MSEYERLRDLIIAHGGTAEDAKNVVTGVMLALLHPSIAKSIEATMPDEVLYLFERGVDVIADGLQ